MSYTVRVAAGSIGTLPLAASMAIEHRRLDVLLERLVERQLLRPLDVVAHRLHVDARPRDRQRVVDLDSLQLDDAAAGEPREHDVLRELRVRAGRRPERRRGHAAVHADRQIVRRGPGEELARGQVEDRLPLVELPEHAANERAKRVRTQPRHRGNSTTQENERTGGITQEKGEGENHTREGRKENVWESHKRKGERRCSPLGITQERVRIRRNRERPETRAR